MLGSCQVSIACLERNIPSLRLKSFINSTQKKRERNRKQSKRERASHKNFGVFGNEGSQVSVHWHETYYEFNLQTAYLKSSQSLKQCAQKQDTHKSMVFLNCLAIGSHSFHAHRNILMNNELIKYCQLQWPFRCGCMTWYLHVPIIVQKS